MKRNLPLLIIGGVLVLAFVGGGVMYRNMKSKTETPANSNAKANASASASLGADPPRVRGNPNAPVTLEEFGDFECPPCGVLYPELKKIEHDYGERLKVIFRENPLPELHKHAYDAARAAEAAGMQGKFWEMHDMLYEKKADWSIAPDPRESFVGYARELGLDTARFSQDMVGDIASMRVALDMRRGKSMGVLGTPTVFLNGWQVPADQMTPDNLRLAIDAALKQKGQ